jgi:hypothetical protein
MGIPYGRPIAPAILSAAIGLSSLAGCQAGTVNQPLPESIGQQTTTFKTQGITSGLGIDSWITPFAAPLPFAGLGIGGSWAGVFRGFGFERAIVPVAAPVPFAGLGLASDLYMGPHGFGWDVGLPYDIAPVPFAGLGRGSLLFDP